MHRPQVSGQFSWRKNAGIPALGILHAASKQDCVCPFSEYQQEILQGKLYCSPKDTDGIFRADGVPTSSLPGTRGHPFWGQKWNWLNLSCSFLLSQQQYKMPGGDTLHKESLMVEMITGASDSLGKYYLSFMTGIFRPMTCLRENTADPHPTYENQHSPSLFHITLSSSWPDPWLSIWRKISGVSLGDRNGRETTNPCNLT